MRVGCLMFCGQHFGCGGHLYEKRYANCIICIHGETFRSVKHQLNADFNSIVFLAHLIWRVFSFVCSLKRDPFKSHKSIDFPLRKKGNNFSFADHKLFCKKQLKLILWCLCVCYVCVLCMRVSQCCQQQLAHRLCYFTFMQCDVNAMKMYANNNVL